MCVEAPRRDRKGGVGKVTHLRFIYTLKAKTSDPNHGHEASLLLIMLTYCHL